MPSMECKQLRTPENDNKNQCQKATHNQQPAPKAAAPHISYNAFSVLVDKEWHNPTKKHKNNPYWQQPAFFVEKLGILGNGYRHDNQPKHRPAQRPENFLVSAEFLFSRLGRR